MALIGQAGLVQSLRNVLSDDDDFEWRSDGRSPRLLADFNLLETEMVVQAADWTLAADVITKEQYAKLIWMIFVERLDLDPSAFNCAIYDFNGEDEYQLKHEVLEDKLGAVYDKVRRSHNFDVSGTRKLSLALSKARSRNEAVVTLTLTEAEEAANDELEVEESTPLYIDHCNSGGNVSLSVLIYVSFFRHFFCLC